MSRVVELKEFDGITCNIDYKDNKKFIYVDVETFQCLENLILESDVIDFLTISVKRPVGKIIRAKNYVGLIQLENDVQLQILPKIHKANTSDTKKIFLKMLRSLKEFPNKIFNEANLHTEKMYIFDIFIQLYIQQIQELVKRGVKSSYYEVENNLNVYKGKIQFSQHLRQNLISKDRFFVKYDEFGPNCAENRLIKSTLLKLLKETSSLKNAKDIQKLLLHFELVKPSLNYESDFSSIKIDRNFKTYENSMIWSKIFLLNYSFTAFSGLQFGKSLLFQMDKLFEVYIGRNFKKIVSQSNWEVSLQDRGYYLFEKKFSLRPDIVLRNSENNRCIIMDTKWKLLKEDANNYGISQVDMYQMYAYAKKYRTNEIWLLYPDTDMRQEIMYRSDDGVVVQVYFIDCMNTEESLMRLVEVIESRGYDGI